MKTKLFQFLAYFNSIDHRHIQLAYFVFALGLAILRGTSEDMGGGTR